MALEDVDTVIELHQLLQEKKDCMFQFLQDESLFHASADCPKCGRLMELQNVAKFKFQFVWRCSKQKCRETVSVAHDSFFHRKYLMDVDNTIVCIYLWCAGVSAKVATGITGFENKAVLEVFESVREICSWQLLQIPEEFRFGGPYKEVELFQTQCSEKKCDDEPGILVIYCREDRRGALKVLKKRDAETVIPIIKECVLPGSKVYSDLSPVYKTLPRHGYKHLTVTSLKKSGNIKSGATITNMAKGYWALCKKKLTAWAVLDSKNFDRHLDVLMWRDIYGKEEVKDTFKNILDHIRSRYELHN
ncbi:hypothetical protein B566_EDAN017272 [Ephemera danica]|nr:hypothetical protein B566_EDAN017272 [Ephemera danica]